MPLKTFVKKMGGINACADRYAIYLGRGQSMKKANVFFNLPGRGRLATHPNPSRNFTVIGDQFL